MRSSAPAADSLASTERRYRPLDSGCPTRRYGRGCRSGPGTDAAYDADARSRSDSEAVAARIGDHRDRSGVAHGDDLAVVRRDVGEPAFVDRAGGTGGRGQLRRMA